MSPGDYTALDVFLRFAEQLTWIAGLFLFVGWLQSRADRWLK